MVLLQILSVKSDQRRTGSAGFEETIIKFRKKGSEGGKMKWEDVLCDRGKQEELKQIKGWGELESTVGLVCERGCGGER